MTKWTDCTCGCCAGYQNLVGSGSRASCTKSPAVTYQCSQYITCSSSRGTRHAQTTVSGDKNKCTCTCASGYYNQRGVGNAAICQRRPTGGGSQPSPPSPPSPPYRAPYVPPPPAPPPYYSPCTNTVKYNCLNVHKRESCSYYSAVCGACRAGYVDVKGACLEQCDRAVDLAFLLDASGSISKSNFDLQLEFTRLLADRFKIGTGKYDAQVALGTFATHAKIESRFGAYPSNSLLKVCHILLHIYIDTRCFLLFLSLALSFSLVLLIFLIFLFCISCGADELSSNFVYEGENRHAETHKWRD